MHTKRILAAVLGICLTASYQLPFAFAEGETGEQPAVETAAETQTPLAEDGEMMETLPAQPAADAPDDGSGQGDDSGTGRNSDSGNPDDPPAEDHKLTGKIYERSYGGSTASAKPSTKSIKVKLGDDSEKTITPDSDGSFTLELQAAEIKDSGEYEWSFAKTDDFLAASGTIKESEEAKIYLRERYVPESSDYKFADSENIVNGVFKSAGAYKVLPTGSDKLSSTQDGEKQDFLMVEVDANGNVEEFFIYKGDDCSKVLSGLKVKLDDGPPAIGTVTTEAGDGDTYVKAHGVYAKEKAELIVNVEIAEMGAGLKKVYLVGKKDGVTTVYEPVSQDFLNGVYTYSIGLPDEETLLEAEVMYVVAQDLFGQDSTETLIAATEDGSSVTIESIAPSIKHKLSDSANSHGWYNKLPTITATATDQHSGLSEFTLEEDDESLAGETFDDKENAEQTLSAKAKITQPSDNGSYKFKISAKDNAGNIATDEFSLKIDLVAPVLKASGVKDGEHYSRVPEITVNETEKYYNADGAFIKVRVVAESGREVYTKTTERTNKVTVPSSAYGADGEYTVVITAKDAAGNSAEELMYEFVKDATNPTLKWSGAKNGKYYNRPVKLTLTAKEHYYKTLKVSAGGDRERGDSDYDVGFPFKMTGEETSVTKKLSAIGTYSMTASATDKAGNSSGTKNIHFTIDTAKPEITITGVRDGGVYVYGQGVAPKYKVKDDYPDKDSVSYTKGGVAIDSPSFEQIKENDGLYTMTVTATDKAGNTATKTISFVVNRFGSWFEYNPAIQRVMGNAFQNIDEDLVITERNISKLASTENKVYKDGKAIDNTAQTKEDGVEEGYNIYRHVFSKDLFADEGAYEINVVSKDESGNEMESQDENGKVVFYVDRTPPSLTVEGIDPKGIKAEQAELTVKASDLLTGVKDVAATVNGSAVTLKEAGDGTYTFTVKEGMRQPIHVTATDGAGNETVFDDSLSVSSSGFSLIFDRFKALFGIGAAAAAGGGAWFALAKRRRDDDDDEEETEETEEE